MSLSMPQTSNYLLSPLNLWLLVATDGDPKQWWTFKLLRLSTILNGYNTSNIWPTLQIPCFQLSMVAARDNLLLTMMGNRQTSLLSPTKSMVAMATCSNQGQTIVVINGNASLCAPEHSSMPPPPPPPNDLDWLVITATSNEIIGIQQPNLHNILIFSYKRFRAVKIDKLAGSSRVSNNFLILNIYIESWIFSWMIYSTKQWTILWQLKQNRKLEPRLHLQGGV